MSGEIVGRELRAALRRHTPARVGLRRAGVAQATAEQLDFQLDHALARDAVQARMQVARMLEGVRAFGLEALALRSAVSDDAGERKTYLRRPDLGRRLAAASAEALKTSASAAEVVFVIADGLSALAVERHALPLLEAVLARTDLTINPVCVVSQGRVAVGDEIGELLGARLVVVLIGERPGLSAADSLGVYITWKPRVGRTDAERNCISNVRAGGLSYTEAAERIIWLMRHAQQLQATGVALKVGAIDQLIASRPS
jgi:ethanolamine ammonia-lyase small subunit